MTNNNTSSTTTCGCNGAGKVERAIRIMAGALITIGILLSIIVHPYWIALPAFVGLNLFQSGFTGWCPAEKVLKKVLK